MVIRDPWIRALVVVMLAIAGLYLVGLIWQAMFTITVDTGGQGLSPRMRDATLRSCPAAAELSFILLTPLSER